MAFYFSSFSFSYLASDLEDVRTPAIRVHSMPLDRYMERQNINHAIGVSFEPITVDSLPVDFDGWELERSTDYGSTWANVSGVLRDAIHFVDTGLSAGDYMYRARLRLLDGTFSPYSEPVASSVGVQPDVDSLFLYEVEASTGEVIDALGKNAEFPEGFDGLPTLGGFLSSGSAAGGQQGGVWGVASKETDPPIRQNENPAISATSVPLATASYTFDIQDEPYPTGGSGIDDSSWYVTIAVTGQFDGRSVVIRNGTTQPFSSTVTCSIAVGADPDKDRTVTITPTGGYVAGDAVVTIGVQVKDLDGNLHNSSYSFTMAHADVTSPLVQNQSPACNTGITEGTDPVLRDTDYFFEVRDTDSGVDLTTLQVYVGPASTGPWTQLVNNGIPILYRVVIVSVSGGYDVTVRLPVSQLWAAGSDVYFRVDVDDNDGNSTQDICGFRVENFYTIKNVIPLSEHILYVEFTGTGAFNDANILQPANYEITTTNTSANPVRVREVTPQRFLPPEDINVPSKRLGDGFPRCVILDTSKHTHWEEYTLTLLNLKDRYGAGFGSATMTYRSRPTKFDEMKWHAHIPSLVFKDTVFRRLLLSIATQDDWFGGRFFPDDWEE